MRIAVLSDIHGNDYALDAVCDDILQQQVDKILVLGDIVSDFYQRTNTALSKVRSLTDLVIRGNRESNMLNQADGVYGTAWSEYKQFSASYLTWQALTGDELNYIRTLPKQLSLHFDDEFSLRMVHGSPFSESQHLREGEDEVIAASAAAIQEKILLCGHTHRPMLKEVGGKIILNVGSVGLNFNKEFKAQYSLIDYSNGNISVSMRKIPYDFDALKASSDLSNAWIWLCLKSIESGINHNINFLNEANRLGGGGYVNNELWDELFIQWQENYK